MARGESRSAVPFEWFISLALLLLVLAPVAPAFCGTDDRHDTQAEADTQESDDSHEIGGKPYNSASLQIGYRFVTPDGPTAAASPYGRLKSGATGAFSAATLGSDLKLSLDGQFLHEDDYHSELFLDYAGYYRLHLESGALWHNLLPERLPPGTDVFKSLPLDNGAEYGVRTATTQVENRIKLGNNPFHLNLGYWQMTREGYEQSRFSDYITGGSNLPATPPDAQNTLYSRASRVDRITREGSVGLDGHLGWFDLSYGFSIRDFVNSAADNRFQFNNSANGALIAGVQAYDTIPDSRVTSHTFKLFSDMSGGLAGSAAYTLTRRENNGGHGDAVPSGRPNDTLQTVAGNISYTPFKELSFAAKYRHQEIDRDTSFSLFYPFSQIPANPPGVYTPQPGTLLVRPATDTVRDSVVLSSTFRPLPSMIYRLEYSAELESRDNIRDPQSPAGSPYALHSDSRQTHTGTAAFYWKPANGLRLNASYSYAACDNPAYGASFSEQQTGKLLLTYMHDGRWGATGSYLARHETGTGSASTVAAANLALDQAGGAATFDLPRESLNNSVNLSLWFSPLERLTVTTSYAFLQSDTDQTILFNNLSRSALIATNYRSTAHVYGIDAAYAAAERLDVSLGFQQVFSDARLNLPQDVVFSATDITTGVVTGYTSAGIGDLTRLVTTETGVSARADWRITPMLGCVLDYSFRLYDSGNPAIDGSVHTTMISLKARW